MLTMLEAFTEQRLQDREGAWNPGRRGGLEGKELCLGPRRLWPEHPTMGDQARNLAGVLHFALHRDRVRKSILLYNVEAPQPRLKPYLEAGEREATVYKVNPELFIGFL